MLLNETLPFIFELKVERGNPKIVIYNAQERIEIKEIESKGDSLVARFPVFNSELIFKQDSTVLTGYWYQRSKTIKNKLAFSAVQGSQARFRVPAKGSVAPVAGKWLSVFSPGTSDSSLAIGVFSQDGKKVCGTYLTPTGDYRYLEGAIDNNILKLSTFDGSHAFLFVAKVKNNKMQGLFYSGLNEPEPFFAIKNDKAQLPNADSLSYLKPGYKKLAFQFNDINGKRIETESKTYANKAIIIQIMGSWCPNCMDESRFLIELRKKYPENNLAILALAFERGSDSAAVKQNLHRAINNLGINYPVVWAGPANKKSAAEVLPMLSQVLSFPTTIVLNKNHEVELIHTGYSGPATGTEHEKFVNRFTALLNRITQ